MAIRMSEARRYFGSDYQLSEQAVAALAIHLDERANAIAEEVLKRVNKENECRAIQGIKPRRRIEVDDVREAIRDLAKFPDGQNKEATKA